MESNKINRVYFLARILSSALFIILLLLILAMAVPYAFGLRPFVVLSNSMSKTIESGSVVYVKKAVFEDIKVSDIATFQSKKDTSKNFTHRIVSIDTQKKTFVTKGDANRTADPVAIGADQLVGKVVFVISYAGLPAMLLKNKFVLLGFIIFIVIWVALEIELAIRKGKVRKT